MALPCHTLARTGRQIKSFISNGLRDHRGIADAHQTEHPAIALDFRRRPERFRIIVGELHCGAAFHTRYFADQTDWVEAAIAAGIAPTEIICQQRAPTGAEANAPAGSPFAFITEVIGA